jgi:tetratricopeptide (TPR) repeat protein
MKIFLWLSLWSIFLNWYQEEAKYNEVKAKAEKAFRQKAYPTAYTLYDSLYRMGGKVEDEVLFNLAVSSYKALDWKLTRQYCILLIQRDNDERRSSANALLGLMEMRTKKYKKASSYFREALSINPDNAYAGYHYELCLRLLGPEQKGSASQKEKAKQNRTGRNSPDVQQGQTPDDLGEKDGEVYVPQNQGDNSLNEDRAKTILRLMDETEKRRMKLNAKYIPLRKEQAPW